MSSSTELQLAIADALSCYHAADVAGIRERMHLLEGSEEVVKLWNAHIAPAFQLLTQALKRSDAAPPWYCVDQAVRGVCQGAVSGCICAPERVYEEVDGAFESIAQACGFAGQLEMRQLVLNVDLTTWERVAAFTRWREKDGTKAGLLKLARKP